MQQGASPEREFSLPLEGLADAPERLELGLKVLDVGLQLAPGFVLDLVLVDRDSRPVVVLGEGSGGAEALLGRGVCVLAEVRRTWHLLDRLFPQEGVTFGADPRLVLVARRFSDALHGAVDLLAPLAIELVEAREVEVDGATRLLVTRVGGALPGSAGRAPEPPAPAENVTPPQANGGRRWRSAPRAAIVADEPRNKA